MDIKLAGELITKFKPYSMIIDKEENVLWISKKMEGFISLKDATKVKTIFGSDLYDIQMDLDSKVILKNEKFSLTKYKLSSEENIILIFDLIGDYNNLQTKAFSLEMIIDDLNDGVLLSDKEGKVIIYNRAMEELEKRDSKDMLGEFIWDAYGYYDKSKSEHMQVFDSGVPIIDKYKAHAVSDGRPIYKSYSTIPIKMDGDIIGVYTISKNETKLQSLLSEIVELKRQFNDKEEYKTNSNGTRYNFSDIIGSSSPMKQLIKEAEAISWLDNSILLVGDTGTGKEVFAQSIHNFGKYKNEPFIGINCSAIPENLLESILFGSVKGAYTGALDASGLFEEAGSGTLFLDELNSMPINMQTKLLRVLQERVVRRVGGKENYPVKCRVISAMNEDPYSLIESGKLRQDLFYRIAGYNLYIPSLKERGNDLFELSEYYISKYNLMMNKDVIGITDQLKKMMEGYNWPGNIRELEHFIQNIMVRTGEDDRYLRTSNIPSYILDVMLSNNQDINQEVENYQSLQEKLDIMERQYIIKSLESNYWNVTRTSEELGVTRQSLIYRMRKLNIERN